MVNEAGLLVFALLATIAVPVIVFADRDRGFPLSVARRGCAVVMGLDAALGWAAFAAPADVVGSPGWWMSLALVFGANIVAGVAVLMRGVSLPTWLRIGVAVVCFFAPIALVLVLL